MDILKKCLIFMTFKSSKKEKEYLCQETVLPPSLLQETKKEFSSPACLNTPGSCSFQNKLLNPFISITPSKPLMSSGSWVTLHNCEIFYLLAVNYDPATTDLIFIRVNIYPGPGEGGSLLIF